MSIQLPSLNRLCNRAWGPEKSRTDNVDSFHMPSDRQWQTCGRRLTNSTVVFTSNHVSARPPNFQDCQGARLWWDQSVTQGSLSWMSSFTLKSEFPVLDYESVQISSGKVWICGGGRSTGEYGEAHKESKLLQWRLQNRNSRRDLIEILLREIEVGESWEAQCRKSSIRA